MKVEVSRADQKSVMPDVAASQIENARRAGWNPDDGPAPVEHGEPVEGLASGYDLDALAAEGAAAGPSAEGAKP